MITFERPAPNRKTTNSNAAIQIALKVKFPQKKSSFIIIDVSVKKLNPAALLWRQYRLVRPIRAKVRL